MSAQQGSGAEGVGGIRFEIPPCSDLNEQHGWSDSLQVSVATLGDSCPSAADTGQHSLLCPLSPVGRAAPKISSLSCSIHSSPSVDPQAAEVE